MTHKLLHRCNVVQMQKDMMLLKLHIKTYKMHTELHHV